MCYTYNCDFEDIRSTTGGSGIIGELGCLGVKFFCVGARVEVESIFLDYSV